MTTSRPQPDYSFLAGFDGDWRDTWWNADFLDLMATRWRLHEVRRALDVGCGVGHWGRTLLPRLAPDATLTGVDREAAFIERASEAARGLGLAERTRYLASAVEALPFDDASFDLVTCQTVLIHVADVDAALREMVRVLRPGGLVAVAEPSNLGESMAFLRGRPSPSFAEILALIDFQHTCEQGKRALGRGDSSVGDLLPAHFSRAGLADIAVYQSDKCAWLLPPYATRDQAIDARQLLMWIDAGLWMGGGGTREETERLYLAGGGDPAELDALWDLAMRREQLFKEAIVRREYSGGRAVTCYLVSGRKAGGE